MPEITIPAAWSRQTGDFPEFPMENMLWEETPTNEKGVALMSRPPLVEHMTVGAGPIRGTLRVDDLFDGDEFVVSGSTLYRVSGGVATALAVLDGDGPVRWANSAREVVVTRGQSAYSYDGTDTVAIAMPDGMTVNGVTVLNNLFVYALEPVTGIQPGRYYFSTSNDARLVNALDYINAESLPDRLVDVMAFGDNLYLAGSANIEVAMTTNNPDAPFVRIQQRTYDIGVKGVGLMVKLDNAVHVLAEDNMLYRLAQVPERISNHSIEEKVKASATHALFSFKWEGHNFIAVRLDQGTWLIDMATRQPTKFTTYGRATWAASCAYDEVAEPRFGDDVNGTIWKFGSFSELDCGQPFRRVFPAVIPISGGSLTVYNILIDHAPGATTVVEGQGSDPLLDMRFSRDAGRSWSISRTTRLGRQGEARRMARFGSCGMFDDPGAIFEFSMTDPSPLRISRVRVNDSLSGRGRS